MLELVPDLLHLGEEAFVHHEHAGLRLVDHPREGLAAQSRVDAEERESRVAAPGEEREQLGLVVEEHRHVPGTGLVDGPQPSQQEMGRANRFVPELAIGPAAVPEPNGDPVAHVGVPGARVELRAEGERNVELGRDHAGLRRLDSGLPARTAGARNLAPKIPRAPP